MHDHFLAKAPGLIGLSSCLGMAVALNALHMGSLHRSITMYELFCTSLQHVKAI